MCPLIVHYIIGDGVSPRVSGVIRNSTHGGGFHQVDLF